MYCVKYLASSDHFPVSLLHFLYMLNLYEVYEILTSTLKAIEDLCLFH